MLILPQTPEAKSKWLPFDLGNGESFELQISRPNYNHMLRCKYQRHEEDRIAARLLCVTDWRDIYFDQNRTPIPFNRELFQAVLADRPAVLHQLVKLFATLFGDDTPGDAAVNAELAASVAEAAEVVASL